MIFQDILEREIAKRGQRTCVRKVFLGSYSTDFD